MGKRPPARELPSALAIPRQRDCEKLARDRRQREGEILSVELAMFEAVFAAPNSECSHSKLFREQAI